MKQIQPLLLAVCLIMSFRIHGQYEANPLSNQRWGSLNFGLNNANNVSWHAMAVYNHRSDVLLTQFRGCFTQELISAADDTCTARKSKMAEAGILWGDGWRNRYFHITAAAGMSLNLVTYCKNLPYEKEAYVTGVTVGIPVQVDFGVYLSERLGANLTFAGNWNFRQAYFGLQLGMYYVLKNGKS